MAPNNETNWLLGTESSKGNASSSLGDLPGNQESATELIQLYRRVEFGCAVVLALLSPITVLTNGLLLGTIWRDPAKCLRKAPNTILIVGLCIVDFITGLTVEPAFVFHYFSRYMGSKSGTSHTLYIVGGNISTIAISSSFVIVLAMSISQFIAITRPHSYKNIVTKSRVIILVVLIVVYFLSFSMIQFTGISRKSFLLLDVVLHPTLISVCLVVIHLLMHRAFRERVQKPARSRTLSTVAWPSGKLESGRWESELERPPADHVGRAALELKPTLPAKNVFSRHFSRKSLEQRLLVRPRKDYVVTFKDLTTTNIQQDKVVNRPHLRAPSYKIENPRNVSPDSQIEENGKSLPNTAECESQKTRVVSGAGTKNGKADETKLSSTDDQKTLANTVENRLSTPTRPRNEHLLAKRMSRNSLIRLRKPPIEKQFTIVTFYLSAILLFSCIPHVIVFFIFLFKSPANVEEEVYINAALRITDLLLFVKVALDAFIYAWRLPSYRKAILATLSCSNV